MKASLNRNSLPLARLISLAGALALTVLTGTGLLTGAGCQQSVCASACERLNECLGLSFDCNASDEHGTCSGESVECNQACVADADCATLVDAHSPTPKADNAFIACNNACPHNE
jgi:hypothetical protein